MIIPKWGTATSKTEDSHDGNDFQKGHAINKGRHIIIAWRRMVMKKM